MELKFPNCVAAQMGLYGSNCTFMELKYLDTFSEWCHKTVLIVPLWN